MAGLHGHRAFIHSRSRLALLVGQHQKLGAAYAGRCGKCSDFKATLDIVLLGHGCLYRAFTQVQHRLQAAGAALAAHLAQLHIGFGLHTHQRPIGQAHGDKAVGRNLERVSFLQQLAFLHRL